jgi:diguanylate cyclase (GGDEF)-like protein
MRSPPRHWFARPVAPLSGILILAFASLAFQPNGAPSDEGLIPIAAAVGAISVLAAFYAPWSRLPSWSLLALPLACDAVLGLLRQAQEGATSGFGPLTILGVVWMGLALGPGAVAVVTAATAALFAVPMVFVGAPLYPGGPAWRGVVLWFVVSGVVGFGANRVVAEQRRQTKLADERGLELDRLVATQNAIATAAPDLDSALRTVVEEAQRLTHASAAVVELPEGDELVYRAVAGTARAHAWFRLARATSISGLALDTQQVLSSPDTEDDPRVDQDACRNIGARSLIVVPLIHDGAAIGVLKVYADEPNAFRDEHVQVLALLANMIAGVLARADLMRQLQAQAVTDELTTLPNRRGWYEHLGRAFAASRRSGAPLSVILLDINGLKRVNDLDGHAAGDLHLLDLSRRWAAILRETDLLGRLGGDEFGIVLEGANAAEAEAISERLEDVMPPERSASAGTATWDGEEDASALVSRADEAMYERKRRAFTSSAA